jgi:diacylglycerol kinase family enzyme
MSHFSTIVIIYNPHSTGHGAKNAKDFAKKLRDSLPASTTVKVVPTKHAGHAETLTRHYAESSEPILVISSSGDGGYHEVINGAIMSGSSTIVTGLLPSGNANDHYHALHTDKVIDRIKHHKTRSIDVLKVSRNTSHTEEWHRYAHSYVGIGISSQIGKTLTETALNPVNEIWLVIKQLLVASPVNIIYKKQRQHFSSLIWSNIGTMSKVMTLNDKASVTDGKFEVSSVKSRSLGALIAHLVKASTVGLDSRSQGTKFRFTNLRRASIQLDGEVFPLPRGSQVTISCEAKSLRCII